MSERTEAPTPYKLKEARRKGQVARSPEVNSAVILLAAFGVLTALGHQMAGSMRQLMEQSFTTLATAEVTPLTLMSGGMTVGILMMQTLAPIVLAVLLAGVVANVAQVGFQITPEVLKPSFERLNPVAGLKRIFSMRGGVELFKSLLKLTIISYAVISVLNARSEELMILNQMPLDRSTRLLTDIGLAIGMRAAATMLIVAAADYFYQRHEHTKSLRMSKQEIIEEQKRFDNPQIKARIRQRQRQISMNRMMAALPEADVVITNPTHYAVALKYDPRKRSAPIVIAKGERLIALRIKEKAKELKIPMVENVPLARGLYKQVKIGHEVPTEFYQAVAEVLAFVYRLRRSRRYQNART